MQGIIQEWIKVGVKGGPLGFWYFSLLQNIKKLKGDPLETNKKWQKSRTVPKKSKGPIVLSGFVSYVENGVNERGTLCTK